MYDNLEVKLDAYGNIDQDYYVQKAYDMRSEYTAELISALSKKIKAFFSTELPRFHIGSLAHR